MKTRVSFVSNSSSSSFICVVEESKAREILDETELDIFLELTKTKEVFGHTCRVWSTWENQGCSWTEYEIPSELVDRVESKNEGCDFFDFITSIEEKVSAITVFSHSVNM